MNPILYLAIVVAILLYSSGCFYYFSKAKQKYEKNIQGLKRENEIYLEGIASAEVYLWRLDINKGTFWIQDTFKKFLGYSEDCNLTSEEEIREMFYQADREKFDEIYDYARRGIGKFKVILRLQHYKGHFVWAHISSVANYDTTGQLIYLAGSLSDVTTAVATEDALKEAHRTIEKSKRVNTSFLAKMSHEIRTPLNAISGYVQLLERDMNDSGADGYLMAIKDATDSLVSIMSEIIDAARIEAGEIKIKSNKVNLWELMESYRNNYSDLVKDKPINYEVIYVGDEKYDVLTDEVRLNQILSNIIRNAIQYTDKGHITFRLQTYKEGYNRLRMEFLIEDSGKGIEDQQLVDYLNDNTQESSLSVITEYGLGISVVYNLVKLMKGTFHIVSKEKVGTTITFSLCGTIAPAKHTIISGLNASMFNDENDSRDKHILVVEDNEINRTLVSDILRMLKIKRFDLAKDGEEALTLYHQKDYKIVITDILMPGISGCELAKQIRKENAQIPLIAMTANVLQDQLEEYYEAGINDYVPKPIDIKRLKEILDKYLEE